MDHDSVIEDWRRNAQQHDGDNYEFLRSLKVRDYGSDPDELAAELHERAFQIVDCTRCANCCKTMGITFEKEDIERIAGNLNTPTADFIEAHLEVDQENGQFKTRPKPCPFLGGDTCPQCGAEFDVTLFTFGRRIRYDCGGWVDLAVGHRQASEDGTQLVQHATLHSTEQQHIKSKQLTRSRTWGNEDGDEYAKRVAEEPYYSHRPVCGTWQLCSTVLRSWRSPSSASDSGGTRGTC